MENFFQKGLKPLGSYTWVFTVSQRSKLEISVAVTSRAKRVLYTYLTVSARQASESDPTDVKQANVSVVMRKCD